jgi:hypothetical protein
MHFDSWATEEYLNNTLLKELEAIDYTELCLDTNPDATDLEEEDISSFFKDLHKPNMGSIPLEQSPVLVVWKVLYMLFTLFTGD